MPEILKERSELDPQFQWDLTPMFENDAAWETTLTLKAWQPSPVS